MSAPRPLKLAATGAIGFAIGLIAALLLHGLIGHAA